MFENNADFYPTPATIIRKMLDHINFSNTKTFLEPSAGKGDLVEGIQKRLNTYSRSTKDVDVIEVDKNLQHILKGKNLRLVHDDFLTYHTYKSYDVIVLNPPFSSGDKHLLKAIQMQESGGEIVCLLNADTLSNPYTVTRKDLKNQLEKYNAEIEYIENAFVDAERKTGVTVALIYINIPKTEKESVILDRLKQEEVKPIDNTYSSQELIHSDFIEGIVQQYNYEVKAGLKLIHEYNTLKPLMLNSFKDDYSRPVLKLELDYNNDNSDSLENAYVKQIRLKYWKALFDNDQFMGLFTSNLKRKYMEHVEELKDYDFSFFNIYTLRIELGKEMIQGVEDTILNLFDEFSHKHYYAETSKNIHLYNGWKTNKAYKINKKVIIPLSAYDMWSGSFRPSGYQVKDKLKDVEKVFNYLDAGYTEDLDMDQALKMAEYYHETKKIDLKYFTVTFYKKGTCHIEFKNEKLLHKFNVYGSEKKGWLPPSYGKANYKDMSAEEKEVINNFEGEQSYKKVLDDKDYYIVESEQLLKLTS
ncbi:DUF4942 domain-containing protein [Halobacillus litoralis]|uniref:DUF4942 domain-containing protein n=1 Tax=Halobacillus litoralis TaxID=45668 RepID=UPI001CD32229|nr:DUF4942 domain-containing protein [Halobacillus litoralis]MCA1021603.1 DUF4942 domain-containing protein [Halobacillus litoralis]